MLASAIRYVSQFNFFLASFEEGYILTEHFFGQQFMYHLISSGVYEQPALKLHVILRVN